MAQTRDTLLAVLQRTMDPNWLQGILDDPDSQALLYAQLDMLVALASAADWGTSAGLISSAPGGQPGVTTVVAARADTSRAVTIPQGYPFVDQRGVQLVLAQPVPLAIGQAQAALPLLTIRQTMLVNTVDDAFAFIGAGAFLDAAVAPGSAVISDGVAPVLGPVGTTTGPHFLTLFSSDPITGGDLDWLSAHGNERGQRRQASEPTEDYRLRVRNIPDAVSPHAIAQAVRGLGVRLGLVPITIREPFEDGADAALKAEDGLGTFATYYLTGTLPAATSAQVDFLDDPFFGPSPLPAGFVLEARESVSNREGRAYFRIEAPSGLNDPDGLVLFCDSGFCDDPVWGYPDIHTHPAVISTLMAVWEEAYRKRAGGVQFDVLVPIAYDAVGVGHAQNNGATTVVTMTPPAGKTWLLLDLVSGLDAARSGTYPRPPDAHQVTFTFADSTTFSTLLFVKTEAQHLSLSALTAAAFPFKPITQIQGVVFGDGTRDLGLVIDARVVDSAV